MSACLPASLSACQPAWQTAPLTDFLSVWLPVCQAACLNAWLSACLTPCLNAYASLTDYLSASLTVCLFVCQPAYLLVCLFACLLDWRIFLTVNGNTQSRIHPVNMYRVDTGDGNEFQNEFYMWLCIYSLHITVLVKESPTALYNSFQTLFYSTSRDWEILLQWSVLIKGLMSRDCLPLDLSESIMFVSLYVNHKLNYLYLTCAAISCTVEEARTFLLWDVSATRDIK